MFSKFSPKMLLINCGKLNRKLGELQLTGAGARDWPEYGACYILKTLELLA